MKHLLEWNIFKKKDKEIEYKHFDEWNNYKINDWVWIETFGKEELVIITEIKDIDPDPLDLGKVAFSVKYPIEEGIISKTTRMILPNNILRKATNEEIELYKMGKETKKYNL